MKKETAKRIRLIYGILLSAISVVAGICLMAACISIYRSGGEQIYTAQKVADSFSQIALPVYLWLAMILAGFILDFALPADSKKRKAEKDYAATLQRLLEKRDLENAEPALREQILTKQKRRKQEAALCIVLLAVCSVGFLFYGANPANFHQSEINASMAKAVLILFCCLAVPFGFALGTAYRTKSSLQKEIELVKQIPAGEKKPEEAEKKQPVHALAAARWVLLCLALVLLVYGYFAGGTADVLTKAVNICTECVGLG